MTSPSAPVLITGCSSGIGQATALYLARAGRRVIAGVKELRDQGGLPQAIEGEKLPIEVVELDVTSEESANKALAQIEQKYGALGALVNNAGIAVGGFFDELDEDELRAPFEVNVFGAARVTRLALPLLRKGAPAHIIFMSSMAGRMALSGMSAYHATKFALEGLAESLYYELAPHRVAVALVEPGMVRTPIKDTTLMPRRFHAGTGVDAARSRKMWELFLERYEKTARPPEHVARVVAGVLARPDPSFRHVVGTPAKMILRMQWMLPERLWMWLWRKATP